MPAEATPVIRLRPTVLADVPVLFRFQSDPISNELAGTKPRGLEAFNAHWEGMLADPAARGATPRAIIADGALVGSIDVFGREGADFIGYWIGREHWGRGIAGRAIALMLGEVARRPLFASVAAHNAASLRALARNGFAVVSRQQSPASERYLGCETVTLVRN
jgi:RimJ/RimL family protein N-acetyltransferase